MRQSDINLAIKIIGSLLGQQDEDYEKALHTACAIKAGCDYLITSDKGMTNKGITKIKIVNPIDFIRETEDSQ